ncbi:uncharacterized protein [Macrobrachium rosenbergii]|uniref:uncharacterized protein n=1 Tax=Macrobrachium rosenbergii TaxID=79674 RepID=UPI0034D5E960
MNASTRRYFVTAIVLTLCPHGISARGFNSSYLSRVKASVLQVNDSDSTTELVSRALTIMREERPVNFRILHHERFQDTVNSLNPHTMAINGIITFQFREEVVQIQQLLFPASGKTFLILFSPPEIIPRIFQKIQRDRIASHFVTWLIILRNENDLEEVLLGLEGKMEDGTQVVLLIGTSSPVGRFFHHNWISTVKFGYSTVGHGI